MILVTYQIFIDKVVVKTSKNSLEIEGSREMYWNNNLEQFIRQLTEWQRGLITNFTSTLPGMQSSNTPNFRENLDNTLKFQESVVTNTLEFQASLARMSIEAQKQFWDGYFNTLRNTQTQKSE